MSASSLHSHVSADTSSHKELSYSHIMSEKISQMLTEAQTLRDNGECNKAIAKLSRAIVLQPLNSELFEKRAEVYVIIRNYDLAIANFQKVLSLRIKDDNIFDRIGQVYWVRGEELYAEGRYRQALEVYEQVAVYRPEDRNIVKRKISCLQSLDRYEECVEMIRQELEADHTNPELYILRAKLKRLFGDTSATYYDVCSALTLDPCHSVALAMKVELEELAQQCKNQAVHHSLVGRKLDALKKISTAIETDPAVAEYHIFRGALFRRLKDFQAAVDDFLTAMDKVSHQQDSDVYVNASKQLVLTYNDFAMECFRQRHFNEAVLLLNKAIKEEKKEKGLYLNRGDCFYRLNDLPFSLADYQQALELDPSDWDVSCRISIVYCELGVECYSREQYSKAEAHFTAAIRHNPKVSRFYVCRARSKFTQNNVSGTKEDLIAALTLDPNNEECVSLIARALPGKTNHDLLNSPEAEACKKQLENDIQKQTGHKKYHSNPNEFSSTSVAKLLRELDLKFEVTVDSSSTIKDIISEDSEMVESEPLTTVTTEGTLASQVEEEDEMVPRNWTVLCHPLPELTSDPQGVMPVLRDCLKEHSFHKKIYYSKKNATEDVKRVLRIPPELARPIKVKLE